MKRSNNRTQKPHSSGPRRPRPGGRQEGSSSAGVQEGIVSAHRSGFGFVRVEGQELNVFLPPPQMAGITSGDRVRINVSRDRTGRLSGEVEAILARGVSAFLATVEGQGRSFYVHSVDRRLSLRFQVPEESLNGARDGDWVIARITRYPDAQRSGAARVERRLDPDQPLELACESAIARAALPTAFSVEALREADAHGDRIDPREVQAPGRVDLRELPLVTIDGDDARDFDDAVFAEVTSKGYRVVVAIADVSHYVRPGTALDAEARERGTSVYFPGRVLPMLPNALSDHLCSLEPDVERLCLVADMTLTSTGQLRESKFYPAVMRSHARLTYTRAHKALFERDPEARQSLGPLFKRLEPLVDVYHALLKARHRRGALDFDSAEAGFEFDAEQRVRAIKFHARNDAHKLVEECMILANVATARALKEAHAAGLYRVHAVPEQKKLDVLLSGLAALGIAGELPETVTPRDLCRITERLGKALERPFVESLVVRSMPQALYQPTNIGHFGLALTEYAHFTSPIRRYPDLVVHRALKAIGDASDRSGRVYGVDELGPLGQDLSRLEKRADEADRYVDTFLKISYLRARLGQTFEGLVTTVVEFGAFVQLTDFAVDGLLHLESLRDDEYVLEQGGHAWVGRRSKRRLALGSRIRVIVTNANPVEGLIDLELDA